MMINTKIVSPIGRKLGTFLLIMFFLYLGDGMIADFVPGFLQEVLGSPLLMGLVMSASSVAGIVFDLLSARLLTNVSVKKMVVLSVAGAMLMVGLLYLSTYWPVLIVLVLAMISWGLFYEFFGFSSQKFVVSIADRSHRAAIWGIIDTFRALGYAIGPLALSQLVVFGYRTALFGIGMIFVMATLLLIILRFDSKDERKVEHEKITIKHEIQHWRALIVHVWPMVLLGILLGFIDAVYWTTGTIVNDMLAKQNPWGGLFLTTYMISALFVGIILGKREMKRGKKKTAEILVLLSGVILIFMQAVPVWWWYLLVVFVSTLLSATAWPLLDAVYTDLLSRMGREQIHMMGLKNASHSFAYIIGPILAGIMAQVVGEIESFVYLGGVVVGVAGLLLFITPKKLKLPQKEIRTWE